MTTVSTEASCCAAPISRPPLGNTTPARALLKSQEAHDPIQTHARAVNSLRMALQYLNQPESNVPGAGRKAVQALAAINALRGIRLEAANDEGASS